MAVTAWLSQEGRAAQNPAYRLASHFFNHCHAGIGRGTTDEFS